MKPLDDIAEEAAKPKHMNGDSMGTQAQVPPSVKG